MSGAATRQALGRLTIEMPGPGFTDMTAEVARFVAESGIQEGLLTAFCRHTSASLTIQENADPDVRADFMTALDRLARATLLTCTASKGRTTCRPISARR
jgi:thiamine phosphate synthase YjbQ (UPF0047 family)